MSYLKLLSARRNSGRQPTMKPVRLSNPQKALAEQGLCIQCGDPNRDGNSYLCEDCQAKETLEDIQAEISNLRREILGPSGGSE
jgi:hypothetical protein